LALEWSTESRSQMPPGAEAMLGTASFLVSEVEKP
jgi:hypothetical protein